MCAVNWPVFEHGVGEVVLSPPDGGTITLGFPTLVARSSEFGLLIRPGPTRDRQFPPRDFTK